jgi:hypothetical protein
MENKILNITDKTFIYRQTGERCKREAIKRWKHIEIREYTHDEQLALLQDCIDNSGNVALEIRRDIERKLASYYTQDVHNSLTTTIDKLDISGVLEKMNESMLSCYYCHLPVNLVYIIYRDERQWTLDRIDNYANHTLENCIVCCLKCNLDRRRINKEKFYKGKHLRFVKKE